MNAQTIDEFVRLLRGARPPPWEARSTETAEPLYGPIYEWLGTFAHARKLVVTTCARGRALPAGLVALLDAWDTHLLVQLHAARRSVPGCEVRNTNVLWLMWLARADIALHARPRGAPLGADAWAWSTRQRLVLTPHADTPPSELARTHATLRTALGILEQRVGGHLTYAGPGSGTAPDDNMAHLHSHVLFLERAAQEYTRRVLEAHRERTPCFPPAAETRLMQRAAVVTCWTRRALLVSERLLRGCAQRPEVMPDAAVGAGRLFYAWVQRRLAPTASALGDVFWREYTDDVMRWCARPYDGAEFAATLSIASGNTDGAKWTEVWSVTHTTLETRYTHRDCTADHPKGVPQGKLEHPEDAATRVLVAAGRTGTRDGRHWLAYGVPHAPALVVRMFHMLCESDAQAMFPWADHCVMHSRAFFASTERLLQARRLPIIIVLPWWQPVVTFRAWDEQETHMWDCSDGGRIGPLRAMVRAVGLWLWLVRTRCDGAVAVHDAHTKMVTGYTLASVCRKFIE